MVSESELIERLREFLRESDLNTTTTGSVRRKLEEEFGVDLSEKKAFIREQVDLFLQTQLEQNADDDNYEEEQNADQTVKDEPQHDDRDGDEEAEEDDEEEEKDSSRRRSKKLNNEVKKRGGGFSKLCSLSPQLQEFTGVPQMARTEVVKQLWAHIREKNLQDPSNRRNILCDEPLRALFGIDSIDMFQMNKELSKHIWPLDSVDAVSVKPAQKEKQRKQDREREEDPDEPKRKEKRQKGFLAPLRLSDALDPSDKRRILCDEKLKELFDVDSFQGFTVSKLLTVHFVKTLQ